MTKQHIKVSLSAYERIKQKAHEHVTSSMRLESARQILNGKEQKYWLASYSASKSGKMFTRVHSGDFIAAYTWFTTLQPHSVLINRWELTEDQYRELYVKECIEDQLRVEGFEVSHFPD